MLRSLSLLLLAISAAILFAAPVSASGAAPVAAYSFDAGEGEVAEDLAGEHDGAIEGATWFENGRFGSALYFDNEESCVTVEDAPDLQLTEEFTVETWVKPEGNGVEEPLISKETEELFSYSLYLGLQESGRLEGLLGDEEEEIGPDVESGESLPLGIWSHVAMTYDGAHLRLYLNGELQDSAAAEVGALSSEGPLILGCSEAFEDDFEGKLDEVRIYNRELGAGEVAADMGAGLQTSQRAPVAAYSFDAGEGEVAEDLAGEHDGAIEGATWFENGRFGSALYFDNEESCVTVEDAPDLQLTEEFTVETWVKPEGNGVEEPLISKETEELFSYSLYLGLQESGRLEGLLGDEEEEIGPDVESGESLPLGIWSHVAMTYDGAHLRLYLNGELQDSAAAEVGALSSEGPLILGCSEAFEDDFEGKLDEVRIYNRELGAGEVAADMGAGLQTSQRAPVAAYSFDAGEGEVAEDLAGEHDGAIEGATWFENGRFGSALYFDNEESCVTVEDAPDLQLTEEFTVETWVKPEGNGVEEPLISKETEELFSYSLYLGLQESGRLEGLLGDEEEEIGPDVESGESLPLGIWSHVAMTYDGAHLRLYLNGELQDSAAAEVGALSSEGPLILGCSEAFEDDFEGKLDEVRIYNRELGAGEVAADMGAGLQTSQRAPVAAYSFDAGEGEVAEDLAGEHDGAIEGATWFENGRFGSALYFDNEESCVTVEDAPDLQLTEEFTVETWVKPEGNGVEEPLISKETEELFSYSLYLGLQESGRLEGLLGDEEEEIGPDVESGESLPLGIWSHVAMTYDGAHLRLYLNGELQDSAAAEVGALSSEGPLILGCSEAFEDDFEGKLDEVRIYNRELGAGEVAADMGAGLQTSQRAPVAAYSFDAGEGEVAEDLAGEHDGAIEGATWFENGRFGSALYFDNEESCVTVEDAPDLQLTEEFTVETWVKPEGNGVEEPLISKETEELFSYSLYLGLQESGRLEGLLGDEEEEIGPDVESGESLPLGIWSHVAMTYDGAHLRLYLNGELQDSAAAEVGALSSEGPLILGCSEAFEDDFEGKLDEVRIYNRELGESELRQTMNAGFPTVITKAATEVEANTAILNGTADANGAETEYLFEYGPTESYGSVVTGEELGSNQEAIEINEAAVDLAPETTYHYRLVAVNPIGTAYGEDQILTTSERTMTVGEEEELADAEDKLDLIASESKAGPGSFYGMMWTGNLQRMLEKNTFQVVENSGAKMLRLVIAPGDQTRTNEAFTEAAKRGITILPYFGSGPFPKPGTANAKNWVEYAKEMVKKYGPDSSFSHPVKAWEIWNEPNMPFGAQSEHQGKVNPKMFAEFFKEMSQALRSASKGEIEVLTPGLYGYRTGGCHPECHLTPRAFLIRMDEKLSELGYSNAYDAVSLHPYVFKIGEREHLHGPKDEQDVKLVSTAVKRVITAVHNLKKGKPLWITELGFPVANGRNPGQAPRVTLPIQKQLVQASFTMMQNNRKNLNIARAFYYNIQDSSELGWEAHSGLLTFSGKPRPAFTCYSNLAGGSPC